MAQNSASAQAQAFEQAENNRQRDIASSAHERFMQRRREFIERNPFAVSPFERKAVLGEHQARQDQAALRQHELDMATKKNEGAIKVAEHNANGMINQGKSAAEINAGVKGKEIDAGLTKHELEMRTQKMIAGIQADAQKGIAEDAHNTELEKARIQGKSAVEVQGKANEGALAQADAKRQQRREEFDARLAVARERTQAKLTSDKMSAISDTFQTMLKADAANFIPFAETVKKARELYKDDPEALKLFDGLR